jgi:PBP4 family serine-type D-alanyl-D-alanine carboxypeptidase
MKNGRGLLRGLFRFGFVFLASNFAFSQAVPESPSPQSPSAPVSRAPVRPRHGAVSPQLLQELLRLYERSGVGGQLAISVYSVRHQRYEAQWNDSVPFIPASTLKLIVTAAALDAIPEDDAPHTTLEVAGRMRGRTLRGELRVIGGGDPNISDRFYASALDPLHAWADSLRAAGIDTVRGRVTALDTFFVGPHRPEAWAPRHFGTWYGAEVSALSFNDNCFELTLGPGAKVGAPGAVTVTPDVGYVMVINRTRTVARGGNRVSATLSVQDGRTAVILTGQVGLHAGSGTWLMPMRNPPEYFRAGFLTALRDRGVTFIPDEAAAREAHAANGTKAPVLRALRFSAAPLASMIDEINQRSQNLHAEMLLRHLGRKVKGEGSVRAGIAAEYAFLHRLGVDTSAFDLHDGCGLSHLNRVQARAMALLLARMARSPDAGDYVTSLAQPGLDGATGKRMREYTGSGLVRYKTGTLNGVSALDGYVFADDGDTLGVALILNGKQGAGAELLDAMLMRVAFWYNRERPAVAGAYALLDAPEAPPASPDQYIARLRHFSKALIGRPYFLGPTGEGRHGDVDTLPMADLSRMDCVTYIENVLALARAREAAGFLPALLPIRYHGDTVAYANRNHYFVGEWLANNPGDFRVPALPGDTVVRKVLARRKLLAAKGVDGADVDARLRYVPFEQALRLAKDWKATGLPKGAKGFYGVAFMTGLPGLDATHTGFVDVESGKPVLRHAGQLKGEVTEQDFAEYLESRRGKCAGVLFFEFLPPVSGG